MQPQALLTYGWRPFDSAAPAATQFHDILVSDDTTAVRDWIKTAVDGANALIIGRLDSLFRRRPGGMQTLRDFTRRFGAHHDAWRDLPRVYFECDAFAYAFLKRAHNFDVVLPEATRADSPFRAQAPALRAALQDLADFEQTGKPLPHTQVYDEDDYLRLRACLARPSARLERRTLATLLINGPSRVSELAYELGADRAMVSRILMGLTEHGSVVFATESRSYQLAEPQLPLLLFCLRETMGLDYLTALN